MSTVVRFVGGPRFKAGHAYSTPPLVGPIKTRPLINIYTGQVVSNADGSPVLETVSGWEVGDEVTFDRILAEQYGRISATDPADDGDEWLQLFLGTWNANFAEGDEPFRIVQTSSSDSPVAVETAGE